ncbi:MAG: biosynthetic peptidoglycan transglycosylase [Proteocatella sp.]
MKKSIKLTVGILIAIIMLVSATKVVPIVWRGYNLYSNAVNETSIEEKVEQLKKYENYIYIEDVSAEFIDSMIKSEDKKFYKHNGFDLISTLRAAYQNLRSGKIVEGGSTITQQLSKNLYFSFEKKYERKVAELIVAFKLEKRYSKDQILEYYLNIIYFGEGCYGIKEASLHYYGIQPIELDESQAAALIRTLKSPNNYNPNRIKVATEG